MAQFPEIHPEKCPFCGGQLKLFTGKYLWDYFYQCQKCYPMRRFHFKNEQPPDIKAVYQSEEYKQHLQETERKNQKTQNTAVTQTTYMTGVGSTMAQTWEYKVICSYEGLPHYADPDQKEQQMEKVLNKYGALGWELVQVQNYTAIFKRPKQF